MDEVVGGLFFVGVLVAFGLAWHDSCKPSEPSGCTSCMETGESLTLAGAAPCPNPKCPYSGVGSAGYSHGS